MEVLIKRHAQISPRCCAVKSPGFGDRRRAILQDLAILTGGTVVWKGSHPRLNEVALPHLGQARRAVMTADDMLIIDAGGDARMIKARILELRHDVEVTNSDYGREKLQERLAGLVGGVAVVGVGGASGGEIKQNKARFEEALTAVAAAIDEGVVPAAA